MIVGVVTAGREAVIPLVVRGPTGDEQTLSVIVDTGYNGQLALPAEQVNALKLVYLTRGRALIANGSEAFFETYSATIIWDGIERRIEVDVVGNISLIGMSLLYGYDLLVEAVDGGMVAINARA